MMIFWLLVGCIACTAIVLYLYATAPLMENDGR